MGTPDVVHGRAVRAAIWGIPAINYDAMFQAFRAAGGRANQFVFWSRPSDWKNQVLTPNTDAIYLIQFFDTRDAGPMVLEIPGSGAASITDRVGDGLLADRPGRCWGRRRGCGCGRAVSDPAARLRL
jgi:hypothetical protein